MLKRLISLSLTAGVLAACQDTAAPYVDQDVVRPNLSVVVNDIIDLGTLGGDESYAFAVNDRGEVTGLSSRATGGWTVFRWTAEDGMVDLGIKSGYGGRDINELGEIVGTYSGYGDNAFLWTEAFGLVNLEGDPWSWPIFTRAYGINDLGDVVGEMQFSSGERHPTLNGTLALGTFGGNRGIAYDINNHGQVVGYSLDASEVERAFLWTQGEGMLDLGVLPYGACCTRAKAINDLGEVAGVSVSRPFLWTEDDGMIELEGPFGGHTTTWGINDHGHVVGGGFWGQNANNAYLWTREDGQTVLGGLGGSFSDAYDINNEGQIVGWSYTPEGNPHATLWSVTITPPSPEAAIQECIVAVQELVDAGVLNNGQGNAKISKLNAAMKQVNSGNNGAAINILDAFMNQVQAFINNLILTDEQGEGLMTCAQTAIALLSA